VQAFEDQKTQFELNSLSDLQHVEFVAEDRSDVIIIANPGTELIDVECHAATSY
jgi:hypothetical protein